MRRTRFSIAGLMGFVLIVALGIGGLKAANPLWASACYTLTFLGLVAGVLLAIQAQGRKRAFWVGFSMTGWTYFVFVFVFVFVFPSSEPNEPPPRFLTALLLDEAQALFFPNNNSVFFTTYNPVVATFNPTPLPVVTTAPPMLAVTPAPVPPNIPPSPVPVASAVTSALPTTVTVGASTPFFFNTSIPQTSFHHVGQSMATLLLAYLGGLFSLFLAARRERNETNSAPDVSPSSP
jgi:hypothetical protein